MLLPYLIYNLSDRGDEFSAAEHGNASAYEMRSVQARSRIRLSYASLARDRSPLPTLHVRGIGDTASRCRIGHLPFPVHSRRLRWTLSGLRPGRAAYLAGLTTMTSCFSRGRPAAGAMAMLQP